jgi:hypothetical protein
MGITIVAVARSARSAVSSRARCCELIIGSLLRKTFANPAVTIARSLSDTFAGIAPAGVIIEIFLDVGELVQ